MKFDILIPRIKGMLLEPKSEWPKVAAEPAGIVDTYKRYVMVLAAIPAVFQFIKGSVIGYGVLYTTWRTPVVSGLMQMLVYYVLSLVMVFLVALLVDALAPTFGGKRNREQAFKTVAYAWTAAWIVGAAVIVPWLGTLIALAGGVYSIYLLYVGLPHTMGCPPEKRVGYTASIILASVVLSVVVSMIGVRVAGTGPLSRNHASQTTESAQTQAIVGSLAAMSRRIQAASDAGGDDANNGKLGDAADGPESLQSLGNIIAQATGGKQQRAAVAVSTDKLKALLPEQLGNLARKRISAERNSAMGMQNSQAQADYVNDEGHRLKVSIEDHAGLVGLTALAGSMASESEEQTEHGYSRTYRSKGRMITERWDERSHHGTYRMLVGNRFNVTVSGKAGDMDQIKSVMGMLDLTQMEKWAAQES